MFGWIVAWMTPPSRICTPRITSSSDCVQPFRSRRVRVDEREHDEPDRDREQRLERGDEEVRAVLQLVHRADAEEERGRAGARASVPTAE